ncbi:hypothetical protein COOONC_20980 [Cooperia oncophora]
MYDDKELVATCAGAQVIKPHPGYYLTVSSEKVSEQEMNALFSEAISAEICVIVEDSNYRSLRFPRLRNIQPCLPGRPAMRIVANLKLEELFFNRGIAFPPGSMVLEIAENPRIPLNVIEWLQRMCPSCKVTANLGCDLERRIYSQSELIDACAGKRIIRPAKGFMLVLKSSETSEDAMNALCSKAIFMQICLDIYESNFKTLRCPHLKQIVPCRPGDQSGL